MICDHHLLFLSHRQRKRSTLWLPRSLKDLNNSQEQKDTEMWLLPRQACLRSKPWHCCNWLLAVHCCPCSLQPDLLLGMHHCRALRCKTSLWKPKPASCQQSSENKAALAVMSLQPSFDNLTADVEKQIPSNCFTLNNQFIKSRKRHVRKQRAVWRQRLTENIIAAPQWRS